MSIGAYVLLIFNIIYVYICGNSSGIKCVINVNEHTSTVRTIML